MSATQNTFGCIDKQTYGHGHQLQLWLAGGAESTRWTLKNADLGARKSCELDSGSHADPAEARRIGQETFDRVKAEELAKFPAEPATAEVAS